MGEAKRNINSMLKKQGLLPPKPPNMSAAERSRRMQRAFEEALDNYHGKGMFKLLTKIANEED